MCNCFFLRVFLQVGEANCQPPAKVFFRKVILKMVRPPIIELHYGVEGRMESECGQFESLLTCECHTFSVLLNKKISPRPTNFVFASVRDFGNIFLKPNCLATKFGR